MGLHVGIILDGNRRYAKKKGLQPWKGHLEGLENLKRIMKGARELDISELTLYTLSIQNFARSKEEIRKLLDLLKKVTKELINDKSLSKDGVRIKFIGFKEMFPQDNRKLMVELERKTASNMRFTINICAGYGGREEILEAVKKLAEEAASGRLPPGEIKEKDLTKNLWLSSEPQIVIRPGGEIRTSNFLTWQTIYSEWFFVDKMWPEFTKADLEGIIEEFKMRRRRFGR